MADRICGQRFKPGRLMGLAVTVMVCAAGAADRIETASGTHAGMFGGYREERFLFDTADGGRLELARRDVRRVALGEPMEVTLQRSTESPPGATVLLRGFEAGGFEIERSGRDERIPLTFVARVTVPRPVTALAEAGKPGPRPAIDLSALDRADLNAAQREAVETYRHVRGEYDRFIAESSVLVAHMDTATGPARMEALNALRGRRMAEQALEGRLRRSESAVLAALGDKVQRGGGVPAGAGTAVGGPFAEHGKDRAVMLIDTAMFRSIPDQSGRQQEAVARYDAAAEACRTALEQGDNTAVEAAMRRLEHAERDLLNAFPHVVMEE